MLRAGVDDMDSERKILHVDTGEFIRNLGWLQTLAVGLFVLGLTALYAPFYASLEIKYQLGILFFAGGAMFIIHAFSSRKWGRFKAESLIGMIYLTAGVLLLVYPIQEVSALTLFVGIALSLKGILKIRYSRHLLQKSNRQWTLASGTISLLMGIIVLAGLPTAAAWAVGVLVGMDWIFSALSIFMVCHAVRETLSEGNMFCLRDYCLVG
jgi:uncharacterized membrane protein HdeD (DUF308 family)